MPKIRISLSEASKLLSRSLGFSIEIDPKLKDTNSLARYPLDKIGLGSPIIEGGISPTSPKAGLSAGGRTSRRLNGGTSKRRVHRGPARSISEDLTPTQVGGGEEQAIETTPADKKQAPAEVVSSEML